MSRLDFLLKEYKDQISLPWKGGLSAKERVIFLIYNKAEDRLMAEKAAEFQLATEAEGHGWKSIDLSTFFSQWIAGHKHRNAYFKNPEALLNNLDSEFGDWVIGRIHNVAAEVGPHDVLALTGTPGLFGFLRLSEVVEKISSGVKGRLVVFFPGVYENNHYRFLDSRDGWNYLAIPLTGQGGL